MRTAAAATIIVLLGNNIMLGRFPVWVGLLYVIGGIASWLFYQADKRAAEKRQWRAAPERRLHRADLAFGIVGGLLAQHVLRHKTYKPGFVMITALITALHVLTLRAGHARRYAPGGVGDFFGTISALRDFELENFRQLLHERALELPVVGQF